MNHFQITVKGTSATQTHHTPLASLYSITHLLSLPTAKCSKFFQVQKHTVAVMHSAAVIFSETPSLLAATVVENGMLR
jgi:hypothetical protein